MTRATLEQLCINTIRFLAVDAVQKANSGHPGLPMGAATMAYTLWTRHLRHNPHNPHWPNRDRFVLSAGHGSMLLYALLHLTGYDLPLDELRNFRQWGSGTPGHPERAPDIGIETTTGPLGQGFANGVGMAIAERYLAERFNTRDHTIIDHHTFAIVSDGDLEEGVASEAASFAGTMQLSKLIYLYDDNGISIEGNTDITFREDVAARFRAYGWRVVGPIDGNSVEAVDAAIGEGQVETTRPTLIICQTTIGYGSPNKANTASAHGEPLGEEEVRITKQALSWPLEPTFYIPDEALTHFRRAVVRGEQAEAGWQAQFEAYRAAEPEQAAELARMLSGELPDDWDTDVPTFRSGDSAIATRSASGKVLNSIAQRVPELIGGSADLAPSTKTLITDAGDFHWEAKGRNLHFGVREHAMAAIALGMSLHGGVIPYTATFLVFSDYMRPPIRLAAMSRQQVIFIFTHDSIGLGEDGPTHQPVEQLAALRAIPNVVVIRPADANETIEAWRQAMLRRDGPTALILTRQNLPTLPQTVIESAKGVARGAYVLKDCEGTPQIILMASGSEVHLALEATAELEKDGVIVRVVSMPSWELFDAQAREYQDSVLLPGMGARLAIEAGVGQGWHKYTGCHGDVISLERFGASAPGDVAMEKLGFNVENVVAKAKSLLQAAKGERI